MISPIEGVFIGLGTLLLLLFTIARIQGRRSTAACCVPADPRRDARMRGAFVDEAPTDIPRD